MNKSLERIFKKGIGRRILLIMETFPFFITGKLVRVKEGIIVVGAQEGIPIQLVGRLFHIGMDNIVAFFIEDDKHLIPVLESLVDIQTCNNPANVDLDIEDKDDDLEDVLVEFKGQDLMFVLRPKQINILGQVTRPIIVARLIQVGKEHVYLDEVNIRFTSAPDYVFPLPLYVLNWQITLFMPFDRQVQFSLT